MAIRRILVIDDEEAIADGLRNLLKDEGCVVRTAGSAKRGLAEFDKDEWDVVFLDLLLPDMDGLKLLGKLKARRSDFAAVLMGERSSTSDGFAAQKMGAAGFLEKPDDLIPARVLAVLAELPSTETPCWAHYGIVGQSAQMQTMYRLMDTASSTDGNVLIVGESGTGKQLMATAIHSASPRGKKSFIKLTGVKTFSELAERILETKGGTLFIDEVTSIPIELQRRLRLILEEGKIKLEKPRELKIDMRMISSTRFDPEMAIRDAQLSEELYYRVSILTIRIPPLSERDTDIELLVDHILKRLSGKRAARVTGVSKDARDALLRYSWPGNILQLEQAIEQAVILGKGREIQLADLPEAIRVVRTPELTKPELAVESKRLTLEERERQAILEALESTNWNKMAAAALLGLHRPTLYSKMRKHGIPRDHLSSRR